MTFYDPVETWEKTAFADAVAYIRQAPVSTEAGQVFLNENQARALVGHCFHIFKAESTKGDRLKKG